MEITKEWLEEKNFWVPMVEWFDNQDETDAFKIIDKLMIRDEYLFWVVVLIMRLMNTNACIAWAVFIIGCRYKAWEDIDYKDLSVRIYQKAFNLSKEDFHIFVERNIEETIEALAYNELGGKYNEAKQVYLDKLARKIINFGIKLLKSGENEDYGEMVRKTGGIDYDSN